MRKTE